MEAIGEFYAELRATSEHRALPVTVRTLETIIRLSTAAAKARMAAAVERVSNAWFALHMQVTGVHMFKNWHSHNNL